MWRLTEKFQTSLTSELCGYEWSPLLPGHFVHGTLSIGSCVSAEPNGHCWRQNNFCRYRRSNLDLLSWRNLVSNGERAIMLRNENKETVRSVLGPRNLQARFNSPFVSHGADAFNLRHNNSNFQHKAWEDSAVRNVIPNPDSLLKYSVLLRILFGCFALFCGVLKPRWKVVDVRLVDKGKVDRLTHTHEHIPHSWLIDLLLWKMDMLNSRGSV